MDEFDLFTDRSFNDVNGLLNRCGHNRQIDTVGEFIDRSISFNPVYFFVLRINRIENALVLIPQQHLKIRDFPSPQAAGSTDHRDTFRIKQRVKIHRVLLHKV